MRRISYSEAISEAQRQEMEIDPRVFLMGLVLKDPYGAAFGQTKGISSKLGTERVLDMPIAENGYVGAAVGAAMAGMRPVVELQFQDFITICMDQIVQQGANVRYMFGGNVKVPVVLRAPTGGYLSAAAQHSHMLESWFAFIPGLKVVLPSDAYEAKGLLTSAMRDDNFVLYFEHKKLYDKKMDVPEEPYEIPIGKANIKRAGEDITIVAYSLMVSKAMEVAKELEKEKVSAEVIDLRSVAPLDVDTVIASVKKTGKLLVIQETYKSCSVSSEISAAVNEGAFGFLKAPVVRVTAKYAPVAFSPVLENFILPQTKDMLDAALRLCREGK